MIIGIAGGIGCGKTTVANMVVKRVAGAVRMGFGDVVKDEVSTVFAFRRSLCDSPRGKATGISTTCAQNFGFVPPRTVMSVRELMQWWGTDIRRAQEPAYWTKLMEAKVASHPGHVVIDDVRFPNEAACILALGGRLVRIMPYPDRPANPADDHASEHALDGWSGYHAVYFPAYGDLAPVADALSVCFGDI